MLNQPVRESRPWFRLLMNRTYADSVWVLGTPVATAIAANLSVVSGGSESELVALTRRALVDHVTNLSDLRQLVGSIRRGRPPAVSGPVGGDWSLLDQPHDAGLVIALPHLGPWASAADWILGRLEKVALVITNQTVVKAGKAPGHLLLLQPGKLTRPNRPIDSILQHVRDGGVLCVLADDPLPAASRSTVRFFAHEVDFPTGAATIAARTGAALAVGWTYGSREAFHCELEPIAVPVSAGRVAAATQAIATKFEQAIRAHPNEWHLPTALF